jgi:PAS domain-containing protein
MTRCEEAMTMSDIDYQAVFRAIPGATALLSPDLVILDANEDFLAAVGRELPEIVGRNIFDAFPPNPRDPLNNLGPRKLRVSLEGVVHTGERDVMDLMRYDVELPGRPGMFEERYWAVINTPVLDHDGRVIMIENRAEEVTFTVQQVLKAQAVSG